MKKFKQEFSFGCAASGPQTESSELNELKSNWQLFFEEQPNLFHSTIGPDKLAEQEKYLETDIKLMKEVGLNSYRTSISFCKLIKDYRTMEISKSGEAFYNQLIDSLIAAGIEPYLNLSHFDLPAELQKQGGFSQKEVVDIYVRYAEICFQLFGDRVRKWFTFNEPIVTATCTYLLGYHYPQAIDSQKMVQSLFNFQIASARAIEKYRQGNYGGEIGIVLNLSPVYTTSNPTQEDLEAQAICELFHSKFFLDAAVYGQIPEAIFPILEENKIKVELTAKELAVIEKNKVDMLGVNYYFPIYVKAQITENKQDYFTPSNYYQSFVPTDARINEHRGWIIYPKGIYDLAMNIKTEYKNIKFYIAENGMGVEGEAKFTKDGLIHDDYRIAFYTEHLSYLHEAICNGANCFGYHTWNFVDNWSWLNAYKNRYGFIELDIETKERRRKKSSYWYEHLIATRELSE